MKKLILTLLAVTFVFVARDVRADTVTLNGIQQTEVQPLVTTSVQERDARGNPIGNPQTVWQPNVYAGTVPAYQAVFGYVTVPPRQSNVWISRIEAWFGPVWFVAVSNGESTSATTTLTRYGTFPMKAGTVAWSP